MTPQDDTPQYFKAVKIAATKLMTPAEWKAFVIKYFPAVAKKLGYID